MEQRVRAGEHRLFNKLRRSTCWPNEAENLSWTRRVARLVPPVRSRTCLIEPNERIVFTRTLPAVPPIYSPDDWQRLTEGHTLHELGPINNICADWGMVSSQGLLGRNQAALAARDRLASDPKPSSSGQRDRNDQAVLNLAARYAATARQQGRDDVADILEHVPAHPPRTFHEALQALRSVMRSCG